MKRNLLLPVGILFSLFFLAVNGAHAKSSIKWLTIEEAMEAVKKDPKPILVDLYTDWCGWCKKLDADTFGHEGIAKYISKNYYAVKFNAEQRGTVKFRGKAYTPTAKQRTHPLALALTEGKLSYPMLVYIREDGEILTAMPGYAAPKDIEPFLHFFATKAYEKVDWNEYVNNFKSEL